MIEIERQPGHLVWQSIQASGDNGSSALLLSGGPHDAAGITPWNRYSYNPGSAMLLLRCDVHTHVTTLHGALGPLRTWDNPLDALAWLADTLREAPVPGPAFKGGWIGWLSYDLGRLFESLPATAVNDLNWPLFEFTYHDSVWAIDHLENAGYHITSTHDFDRRPIVLPPRFTPRPAPLASNFTREAYELAVHRAVDYIAAGDIFQVNLSQRFTAGLPAQPRDIFRRAAASRAWFSAFLSYGDHALLCNSPELFLRVTPEPDGQRRVLTRPVKGTRPLGAGMFEELSGSAKDQAELNMIVDLERNDLGRVCQIGSVRVTQPRTIETHPTLHHGAATVQGLLRPDAGLVDLLRAAFPGGSITGAPKIRAMQIIEELEAIRRGPYCGAIGFLSVDGHIDLNIAIRTMLLTRDQVHIPVGGGIVADSIASAEYEETLVKAAPLFAALGM